MFLDYFKLSLLNFLGDEIIDYIMLLVTTKKSSSELAKSIDFVMESNTTVFVKWLSTIIKKLQQVTVSTTKQIVSGILNNLEIIICSVFEFIIDQILQYNFYECKKCHSFYNKLSSNIDNHFEEFHSFNVFSSRAILL